MNTCRRVTCNVSVWRPSLTAVLPWVKTLTSCRQYPRRASPCIRSQTTAAKHAPGTDTREKPRLRASDLSRKVQQEREKTQAQESPVSVQQKRVTELRRFSQQLQNVHPNVLAKHLHRSVLYQDEDVVVINKPYGVPVRGKLCMVILFRAEMIS